MMAKTSVVACAPNYLIIGLDVKGQVIKNSPLLGANTKQSLRCSLYFTCDQQQGIELTYCTSVHLSVSFYSYAAVTPNFLASESFKKCWLTTFIIYVLPAPLPLQHLPAALF